MVIDDEASLRRLGVLTEADIARALANGRDPKEVRIRDLMTSDPTVLRPATTIRDAARLMRAGRFRHLPVVHDGGVVGVIDIADVSRAMLETRAGMGRHKTGAAPARAASRR